MLKKDRRKLEETIAGLAPMSPSAVSVLQKIEDPTCSLADLESIIECDAALTLRILKIANSGAIGAGQEIENLSHAAALLGERTIVATAMSLGASSLIHEPLPGYRLSGEDLFSSSVHGATAARFLAAEMGSVSPATAFTAGLLRDIGKIALSSALKSIELTPNEASAEGADVVDFLTLERSKLGMDHCEVGLMVAAHYDLSDALCAAIAHHHTPSEGEGEHVELVDIVHVADFVALMFGGSAGLEGLNYRVDPNALERLGVAPDQLELIAIEALAESGSMLGMLDQ